MGRVVGIDLGTTFSLIAYLDAQTGTPKCIPGPYGSTLCPSVVSVDHDGKVIVGEPARATLLTQPERTIYSVKRLMGRGVADVQDELKIFPFRIDPGSDNVIRVRLGDKSFTAPEISAYILRELKSWAEAYFKEPVDRAVITVPAYFNDAQRQATKDAGRLAGLEVLRLVNEPTAAALAYGLHKQKRGHVAVYDFGGGTFDISTAEADQHGRGRHLSGSLDERRHASRRRRYRQRAAGSGAPRNSREVRRGVRSSRRSDSDIAQKPDSSEARTFHGGKDDRAISAGIQGHVHSRNHARGIRRADSSDHCAHHGAGENGAGRCQARPKEMDEVVLVGGSTRIPLVRKTVGDYFQRAPHCELDPDEVVALGAAVQADILETGVKTMLLLDVTPLSLGIETMGGVIAKIIPRNSTIPASAQELFTTGVENQTAIDVHVLQGERELAKDCRSLARFQLKTPPGPAGLARIEVKFLIDANGILQVARARFADQRAAYRRGAAQLRTVGHRDRAHARGIDRVRRAGFRRAPGDRSAHRSGDDSRGDG